MSASSCASPVVDNGWPGVENAVAAGVAAPAAAETGEGAGLKDTVATASGAPGRVNADAAWRAFLERFVSTHRHKR
jgi:hypothetical protein